MVDGTTPDKDIVQAGDPGKLGSGDRIRLILVDSSVVEGTYREFAPLDSSIYALRYARFLQSANPFVTFPRLGDTLLSTTNGGNSQQWEYVFRGYGLRTLELQRVHQFHMTHIAYKQLSVLKNQAGVKFDLVTLERMSNADQLPRAISIVVESKLATVLVPLDDVRFIEKTNSMNAKWIGLGAGLVIDAIIVASYKPPTMSLGGRWE
jgi:hypothetical protein